MMKTSELTGLSLNWAVAKCLGYVHADGNVYLNCWAPSTDWSQGGPIIERECIGLAAYESSEVSNNNVYWEAVIRTKRWGVYRQTGHTALIAAMRCLIASKFDDDVEIPEELLK